MFTGRDSTRTHGQQPAPAAQAPPPPPPVPIQAPSSASITGQYEQPPIVQLTELLPATPTSGPGFTVQPQVPTNGAMGQYTIVADASVFHNDAGTYYVESLDLLKVRLSEAPAIAWLDNVSETSVFANALASSAERPVADAANLVMHPMDSVTGLPNGVGQFFNRVSMGAGQVYSSAKSAPGSGQAASEAGTAATTALGYDQVRRDLARRLHVDPYSTNPILTKKLNKVAWIMFSARITVDAAMAAVPGSMIITGVEFTNDLVYQTPKADLVLLIQNKLQNMGLSPAEIAAFISNDAISLSLQVSAVKTLEALGNVPGRREVADMIANTMTGYQSRFLVSSLKMLNQWNQQKAPLTRIRIVGVPVAQDQNGTLIMPAPIDYLSWTQRIAGFATDPALLSFQNRVVWIPAPMTPLASQNLAANGWRVNQAATP